MGERIALDTNILVSALGWKGNPHQIFKSVLDEDFDLIVSQEQLEEVARVLEYPKFRFTREEKEQFLETLRLVGNFVEIEGELRVVEEDSDDDIVLETAVKGKCKYLVTGDPHLLVLEDFRGLKIVTAAEFVDENL